MVCGMLDITMSLKHVPRSFVSRDIAYVWRCNTLNGYQYLEELVPDSWMEIP